MALVFRVLKLGKLIIGLLLLPACWAATAATVSLIVSLRVVNYGAGSLSGWWLVGGFIFWVVLFFCLPQPVRTYVLAHELTHALWGMIMGARVSRLRVSARGGSVNLSKTNFLITLAPYFFPFYTMLLLALRFILSFFLNMEPYEPFWLACVGLTWGFHVTFTLSVLLQHQPDIAEHGRLFSYAIIYLFNLLGVGLWIVAVANPTLGAYSGRFLDGLTASYGAAGHWLLGVWTQIRSAI
jgi:hypothetical protein